VIEGIESLKMVNSVKEGLETAEKQIREFRDQAGDDIKNVEYFLMVEFAEIALGLC
jgi:hypothetical protein